MVREARLDALDIATWRETHAPIVRLAAAQGVHVLCQQPLTPTLDEAVALLGDVAGRIRLMVHENRRFAPHFRMIRVWIDAGRLGDVRQCIATMHRSGFLPNSDGKRPAIERAPYMGTEKRLLIAEVLIHQLNVLRFLLGPLSVIAARKLHTEPDMPGETLATIMLETPQGAPVTLACSFVAPGFGATVSNRLEIIGSEASIILDGDRLAIRDAHAEEHRFDNKLGYQACFDEAIAHFVSALIAGTAFETEGEDNLQTLRPVEDSYGLVAPDRVH
jgi:predicted dehydrogenase